MLFVSPICLATCPKLDKEQLSVLRQSYTYGKPYNLGITLAAIALKESSAGKNLINAFSLDYGAYQGNAATICKQSGVFHDDFLCNEELTKVVLSLEDAAKHAIETLLYWQDYHAKRAKPDKRYELTLRSYNEGFSFHSAKADDYYSKYKSAFYTIKECVKLT